MVSIRVNLITELLIDRLVLSGAGKNRSDIFNKAVYQMVVQQLSEEEMAGLINKAVYQMAVQQLSEEEMAGLMKRVKMGIDGFK